MDMMTGALISDDSHPSAVMDLLIARHGRWAVVKTVIALLLRSRKKPMGMEGLNAHLRRDIGLPPLDPRPTHRPLQ